jgi:hypothetical protein
MRAINHALTGATIGVLIGEPLIAVPLAFVSHYICDMIPHYGTAIAEEKELNSVQFRVLLFLDFCLCVLLVVILALYKPQFWILAAVCAFVATSPDLFSINRYRSARRGTTSKPGSYIKFAHGIQWFERPIGAVVEVAWFIAMLIILVPILRHR